MSSKTRKFIGPMSLVAIFAVVGALAAFVVLGNGTAQAQQDITTFQIDPPVGLHGYRSSVNGNGRQRSREGAMARPSR